MRDPVRQKKVVETPEERVRQAVIQLLVDQLKVPASLIAVEKAITIQNELKRADLVVYDRRGKAWMVVECKAPGISINQGTFDQIANYNRVLRAPFLFVTNGNDHLCARIEDAKISFLDALPRWTSGIDS